MAPHFFIYGTLKCQQIVFCTIVDTSGENTNNSAYDSASSAPPQPDPDSQQQQSSQQSQSGTDPQSQSSATGAGSQKKKGKGKKKKKTSELGEEVTPQVRKNHV